MIGPRQEPVGMYRIDIVIDHDVPQRRGCSMGTLCSIAVVVLGCIYMMVRSYRSTDHIESDLLVSACLPFEGRLVENVEIITLMNHAYYIREMYCERLKDHFLMKPDDSLYYTTAKKAYDIFQSSYTGWLAKFNTFFSNKENVDRVSEHDYNALALFQAEWNEYVQAVGPAASKYLSTIHDGIVTEELLIVSDSIGRE